MRKSDIIYRNTLSDILTNGISDEGTEVRPKWSDGEPAHTISKFAVFNRYDLSEDFPMTSIRHVPFKKCVDELLWIWQKNSNNVKDLGSKIWDQWADAGGSIGEAYGFVLGQKHDFGKDGNMTQVEKLIFDLKNNPSSRRMVTNMYEHHRLNKMNLAPCAYGANFSVKDNKLNMVLIQRSNDFVVANSWNVTQYAVLVHLLAHCCDLQVGELVHMITDCHIYDRHIEYAEELVQRVGQSESIKLIIDTKEKDFFKIKIEDIKIKGYEPKFSKDKFMPVAE
ncbi:MAG: thymidylate synthase [Fusobacteriaceae bacterium]